MEKRKFSFGDSTVRFAVLLFILTACWLAGKFLHLSEESFKSYFSHFPLALSGLIFIVLYVVLTFFIWIAKDILKVAGVLVFGVFYSSLFVWAAEIFNAVFLFSLARRLGQEFVEKKTRGSFRRFSETAGNAGFPDLVALRAIVLVPYRFLDLGMGLTSMSHSKYLWAAVIGSFPRVLLIQYYIMLAKELFQYDLPSMIGYLSDNPAYSVFSTVYVLLLFLLIFRLKKLLWS